MFGGGERRAGSSRPRQQGVCQVPALLQERLRVRGAEAVARVVELDRAACELDAEALFAHGVEVALDELLLLLPDGGGEGAEDVEVGLGEGGLRVAGLAAYAALDLERAGAEVDEDAVGDPAARDNRSYRVALCRLQAAVLDEFGVPVSVVASVAVAAAAVVVVL